jgi:hypothetical protein
MREGKKRSTNEKNKLMKEKRRSKKDGRKEDKCREQK